MFAGLDEDKKTALNYAIDTFNSGKQLMILIHGGPGVGKTWLSDKIREAAAHRGINIFFTAYSGAAASIKKGVTLHHLLNMPIGGEYKHHFDRKCLNEIRRRVGDSRLIVVDEISMVTPAMLADLSERLRDIEEVGTTNATLPFGGRHIVLMGDFFQIPPPGKEGVCFYKACVDFASGRKFVPELLTGISLFMDFRRCSLFVQHRSGDDDVHTARHIRMHTSPKNTVTKQFLDSLEMIKAADVKADAAW